MASSLQRGEKLRTPHHSLLNHKRFGGRLLGAIVVACAIVAPALLGGSRSPLLGIAHAQTIWRVTSAADDRDAAFGDGICATASGVCTLRAAIGEANERPGPDTIAFAIPGPGPHTIQLNDQLPSLADSSGGTTIDGYTQPGASANTDPRASNARIMIQLRGQGANGFSAMLVRSAGNVLRGLALYNMQRAVIVRGSDALGNTIAGCWIGLDAAGNTPYKVGQGGIRAAEAMGVRIDEGATETLIGGAALADRNVISGNARDGVYLSDAYTDGTQIANNIIGLDPSGTQQRRNWGDGIDINLAVRNTIVGGADASRRNVISGNLGEGVEISHIKAERITLGNVVQNNFIGSDLAGRGGNPQVTQNGGFGVALEDGIAENTVGPDNVIVRNNKGGVFVSGMVGPTPGQAQPPSARFLATGNRITRNRIGIDADGAAAGNGFGAADLGYGIWLAVDTERTVVDQNIVANSSAAGLRVEGAASDFNTVSRNSFYNNGGLAIDIGAAGVNTTQPCADATAEQQCIALPVLSELTSSTVRGQACSSCAVEVFAADNSPDGYGEGKTFIGAATADANGRFSLAVPIEQRGRPLTATATDAQGNTSEFAQNLGIQRRFLPLMRRAP